MGLDDRYRPPKYRLFLPGCGNRIYHQHPDNPTYARLKAATLDNVKIPAATAHLWIKRKQSSVDLAEGIPAYPENLQTDEAQVVASCRRLFNIMGSLARTC